MVRCMKNKNKTIDEYIIEAKNDIYVYVLRDCSKINVTFLWSYN